MHIFIGSTNPVKINAVKKAVSHMYPDAILQGYDVASGVSEQPMSDEETKIGAENRARAALESGLSKLAMERVRRNPILVQDNSFKIGVGLEGGVFEYRQGELWSTVWVVVVDENDQLFHANGARFKVPDSISKPILQGGEMGPVVNALFAGKDIRRTNGAIGVVTNNFVERTEEYSAIAKMAIGLWYGQDWEKQLDQLQ